jgi:hypothetical protein
VNPTPWQGAMTPPSKTRTPLLAPRFFPTSGGPHAHRTAHSSPSFLRSPLRVTASGRLTCSHPMP